MFEAGIEQARYNMELSGWSIAPFNSSGNRTGVEIIFQTSRGNRLRVALADELTASGSVIFRSSFLPACP